MYKFLSIAISAIFILSSCSLESSKKINAKNSNNDKVSNTILSISKKTGSFLFLKTSPDIDIKTLSNETLYLVDLSKLINFSEKKYSLFKYYL